MVPHPQINMGGYPGHPIPMGYPGYPYMGVNPGYFQNPNMGAGGHSGVSKDSTKS